MGKAENLGKIVKGPTITYQLAGTWNLYNGEGGPWAALSREDTHSELRAE